MGKRFSYRERPRGGGEGIFTDLCHRVMLTEAWLGKLQRTQNNKRLTQTRPNRTVETHAGQGQAVHVTTEQ